MSFDNPRRVIVGLWLLADAFAVIREAQNAKNPGRPLPRPCVLLGSAAAYTVLGVGAEIMPQVFVPVAVAVTLGAFMAPVAAGKVGPVGLLNGAISKLNAISGGA